MKNVYLILLTALLTLGAFSTQAQKTKARFYTNKGNFDAMLYDSLAPITAGNFIKLINKKFYDGIIFHRVAKGFVIQGGDPTGTGSGGPGYSIQDEFHDSLSNVVKTLSMANSGPNTGGSQFFINLVNNTFLDHNKAPFTSKHPVFGIVSDNFNIVLDIANVPVNGAKRPITDVVMDSVRIIKNTTSVNNLLVTQKSFSVFPNPFTSETYVSIPSELAKEVQLMVYSPLGNIVFEKTIALNQGRNMISLQELYNQKLASGIYHVVLKDGTRLSQQKMSIIH